MPFKNYCTKNEYLFKLAAYLAFSKVMESLATYIIIHRENKMNKKLVKEQK